MAALTFPNESAEYRSARNDLLQKEIELRRAVEAVAVGVHAAARRPRRDRGPHSPAPAPGSSPSHPPARLRAWCDERSWKRLRLVSTAGSGYNRAYHGKGSKGGDTTMLNVFRRDGGQVRHFWGTEMAHDDGDPGQHHRGLDFVNPIFNMLDATPEGRGEHLTSLSYRRVVVA